MNAAQVTAVIVTRGDVDLQEIVAGLPYAQTIIWDNSQRPQDRGCYGRYLAIAEASHPVIYFQDDDLIFTAHEQLLASYRPGQITANMPSPWYEQAGYDKLGQALVGAGSLMDRDLHHPALERYLERWPADQLFCDYCDVVVGTLTAHTRHDFGYRLLAHATAPGRIYTSPGSAQRKALMQQRCQALRQETT